MTKQRHHSGSKQCIGLIFLSQSSTLGHVTKPAVFT